MNADFFADAGLGTADVAILAKASSWATLKTATDDDLERGCGPGGLEGASTASCVEQPLLSPRPPTPSECPAQSGDASAGPVSYFLTGAVRYG